MRLLKERKQSSCSPCTKTQGWKKGVKLQCLIGKGKVWKPLGSRNSREQHAPTARACELTREHRSLVTSHLLMRNKRLWNICQLGKNVFPKDLRNILKVIFCKLIQIYRVRLCSTPEIMLGKQSVNQRSLIKEINCLNGCYSLQKMVRSKRWAQVSLTLWRLFFFLVLIFESWTFSFIDPFSYPFKLLRW